MTAQTVNGALAVRDKQTQLIGWLRDQQAEIAMAAASHVKPSAVIRVTQGALRRDPKLAAAAIANPQSLLYALLDAARLGHEPDTDDYYLVPFGNEVTGIEGYKGIIERMFRAGAVASVVAQVVRQNDHYAGRGENQPPVHDYDEFADPGERGPLRGAYAYAIFASGQCSQVIRMGKAEIMQHKAKSRGSSKPDSPWQQWEEAMWKKTVLRALEPYVPTSTEYRTAPAPAAVASIAAISHTASGEPRTVTAPADIAEGEIVDEGDAAGQPEPVTKAQLTKIGAIFTEFGFSTAERAQRLGVVARVVRRDLGSTKELSKDEASKLIDTLDQFGGDRGALIEAMASESEDA